MIRHTPLLVLSLVIACNGSDGQMDADTGGGDCDPSNDTVDVERALWVDADEDGFSSGETELVCVGDSIPYGYLEADSAERDCDDGSSTVFPGAPEVPNDEIDQDCDGEDLFKMTLEGTFVDSGNEACQDEAPGTVEAPNCRIDAAGPLTEPGGNVYVAGGTYEWEKIPQGRNYQGGFDPSDWRHDPEGHPTIVRQPDDDPDEVGVVGNPMTVMASEGDGDTLIEDMLIHGNPDTYISWGLDTYAAGSVVIRRVEIDALGDPDAPFSLSTALWTKGGNVTVEDSIIDGGDTTNCTAVYHMTDTGTLVIKNSVIRGCENANAALGLDARGGNATLEDVDVLLDSEGGTTKCVSATGSAKVFLTGTICESRGGAGAVGVYAKGSDVRVEVKASAIFAAEGGATTSTGLLVEDTAQMVVGNSLIYGGVATEGDAAGAKALTNSELTLVNCLVDGGAAPAGTASAVQANNADVWLASNNLWGPEQDLALAGPVDTNDLKVINDCDWAGCGDGSGFNASEDPGFVDWPGSSFALVEGSSFVDYGIDPSLFGLLVDRDIDGLESPSDGDGVDGPRHDVGPHER